MVSFNYEPVREVEVDGNVVGSYTLEDLPSVREGLMKVMRANENSAMSGNYQRILLGLYESQIDDVVDGLCDELGL